MGQTTTKVAVWVWPLIFNPWTYVVKLHQQILLSCNGYMATHYHTPLSHHKSWYSCSMCTFTHTYPHTPHTATHVYTYPCPCKTSRFQTHPCTLTLTPSPSHTHPHMQGWYVRYQVSLNTTRLLLWDNSTSVALWWGSTAREATDWWAPEDVPARLMEHGVIVSQAANLKANSLFLRQNFPYFRGGLAALFFIYF